MDGLSRKRMNATTMKTMKRKLLMMLLVFMLVATYIPFNRAFAANENGKRHSSQIEKSEGKDAKTEAPDEDVQEPEKEGKAKDDASLEKEKRDLEKQVPVQMGKLKAGRIMKPKPLKGGVDPGIDKEVPLYAHELRKRIPYDNESCYLVNFVYPVKSDRICFWSRHQSRQINLLLSIDDPYIRSEFMSSLYKEIRQRIRRYEDGKLQECDVFVSLDPKYEQLSISIPVKKGAAIGSSILESIPEIRVMKGDKTYIATGWSTKTGNDCIVPLSDRNVFADTKVEKDGYIYATSAEYGKDWDFTKMREDKDNEIEVTIDTDDPDYHGPIDFLFWKYKYVRYPIRIRKGDSLRNYIKEDLPDNGEYKFMYFKKTGDSAHGDTGVGGYNLGYDTPVKDWAKSKGTRYIRIVPVYSNRADLKSIYVHGLSGVDSDKVKMGMYDVHLFDSGYMWGAIPHANVKGKICVGYSTEPNATSAMSKAAMWDEIVNHGKRDIYPVYKEKKKCVIIDYHGGKPAPGSGIFGLKTRFLVNRGANLRDNGFVDPVRDGFFYRGLNVRDYYNWGQGILLLQSNL